MNNRRTYHTSLKDLVRLGLCPPCILALIPRANIYRWKNELESKYYGKDFRDIQSFESLLISIQKHPGFFFTCGRLLNTLTSICQQSQDFKKQLTLGKDKVVKAIMSASKILPLRSALKFFGISRNTFYNWKTQCGLSPIKLCRKRFSHQLTSDEVGGLEKLLTAPKFRHWGISSIQLWAKRNNVLHASLNTWYKYNQLFRWRKMKQRYRKASYLPLRASQPNEYWHADVSIHQCLNGTKGYIYTIIDNATRKILAWKIANHLSGKMMKEVINMASKKLRHNKPPKLVVDGGSENFNHEVSDILQAKKMKRLQASVDIKQSNSMVEAVFRQLKHQFLLKQSIHNLSQLKEKVDFFFTDANQNKPLKVLDGITPDEAYRGCASYEEITNKAEASKAIKQRIKQNQEQWCISCSN